MEGMSITPPATGSRRSGKVSTNSISNQLANIIRKPPATVQAGSASSASTRPSTIQEHESPARTSTSRSRMLEVPADRSPSSSRNPPQPNNEEEATRIRNALRPPDIDGLQDWGIPPEPEGECDPALTAKIAMFTGLKRQGKHFNDSLMQSKAFRNPHIYSKLVEFVDIDETGTNLPPNIWNPFSGLEKWSAERLATRQKQRSEEKSSKQSSGQRTKIAFESSQPSASSSHSSRHHTSNSHKGNSGTDDYSRRRGTDNNKESRYHPYQTSSSNTRHGGGDSYWSDGSANPTAGHSRRSRW